MQHLIQKRQEIEKLRTSSSISAVQAEQLGKSIASSWQRSNSAEIPKDRFAAPISEGSMSQGSALQHALSYCADELRHIAQQSSMVVAVGILVVPLFGVRPVDKCVMRQKVYILLKVDSGERNWWGPMHWPCP